MTLNILFFSVTVKKRNESLEEAIQNEIIEQLYEQHKDRQAAAYHSM
ncbi:YrzI family small protein [Neobacillus niacini]|jgi:uncharacterized protein (TIGR02413 family)|nr:YrzI family small protein [Neobacillus niacini]MBY0146779.1 YrzI family small protein [Neobacillus niacini]